jgi:hypothetical protein
MKNHERRKGRKNPNKKEREWKTTKLTQCEKGEGIIIITNEAKKWIVESGFRCELPKLRYLDERINTRTRIRVLR